MNFIKVAKDSGIATVTMSRGKVNAINEAVVDELGAVFNELALIPVVPLDFLDSNSSFASFFLTSSLKLNDLKPPVRLATDNFLLVLLFT